MSISESFLDNIEAGVKEIGPAGPKAIAEHTGWELSDVREALEMLVEAGRVEKRGQRRGLKFSMPGEEVPNEEVVPKRARRKSIVDEAVDREKTFDTIEDFMRAAIPHLPAAVEYTNMQLADKLLSFFPGSGFSTYEIVQKIAWSVKMGILCAKPVNEDGWRFFFYRL